MSKPFIIVRQATKSGYTEICPGGYSQLLTPQARQGEEE